MRYLDAVVSVWVSSGYEPKDAAMRGGSPQLLANLLEHSRDRQGPTLNIFFLQFLATQ